MHTGTVTIHLTSCSSSPGRRATRDRSRRLSRSLPRSDKMPRFLLFTLAAPLASFGTVAVGERRPTWDRPSKSQIIGLVAGALGIERGDEDKQQILAAGLGYAVRVDDPGQLATDYHTA